MPDKDPLIPKHGGYRNLKSFQVAQLVYDVTVLFCDTHINTRSRTHDQMVQAARSGVQNIAEGSRASGTSRASEMKLTNVARASLEELRLDYEDFLRQRGLPLWDRHDPRRAELIARRPGNVADVEAWVQRARSDGPCGPHGPNGLGGQRTERGPEDGTPSPGECLANGALALILVATSLLNRQLEARAAAFEREGGFTERLHYYRRRNARDR
ncbi:four helix bundle suffix domain-containing protein [Chloroflexota bacterium]